MDARRPPKTGRLAVAVAVSRREPTRILEPETEVPMVRQFALATAETLPGGSRGVR